MVVSRYIYRVYVDSHSLGQLALASKRTASRIQSQRFQKLEESLRAEAVAVTSALSLFVIVTV